MSQDFDTILAKSSMLANIQASLLR